MFLQGLEFSLRIGTGAAVRSCAYQKRLTQFKAFPYLAQPGKIGSGRAATTPFTRLTSYPSLLAPLSCAISTGTALFAFLACALRALWTRSRALTAGLGLSSTRRSSCPSLLSILSSAIFSETALFVSLTCALHALWTRTRALTASLFPLLCGRITRCVSFPCSVRRHVFLCTLLLPGRFRGLPSVLLLSAWFLFLPRGRVILIASVAL